MYEIMQYESKEARSVVPALEKWLGMYPPTGNWLIVVGHDNQFDASHFKSKMQVDDQNVLLIVCNAANLSDDALTSPAERMANTLQTTVYAATTLVTAVVNPFSTNIHGAFIKVSPGRDVESMFRSMSINN